MQGFWLLEPVPVDDIDRLEAYNIVLEQTLGADRCHNIDRIMRLPGTINLPNRKKRLAGREPALASVVEAHWDRRYRLEDFQPATASDAPNENPGKANRHDTEAPPSEVDIDALPVSTRIRNLIRGVHGHDRYYQSRSEAVMAVLVAMAANGCSDEQMTAVVFDQRFPDGAHVRDHKKPNPYQHHHRRKRQSLGKLM